MIEIKNPKEFIDAVRELKIPTVVAMDYLRAVVLGEEAVEFNFNDPAAFITWWLERPEMLAIEFDGHMGGNVYICETEEDLQQIKVWDLWNTTGEDLNVTNRIGTWDACDFILNDPQHCWALFFLAHNNAGGNVYYVPKKFWEKAQFYKHYCASNREVYREAGLNSVFKARLLESLPESMTSEEKEAKVKEYMSVVEE